MMTGTDTNLDVAAIVTDRFGPTLKRLRESRRLTLAALGELVGLSDSYLSDLERGDLRNPTLDVLVRLARALRVMPSALLEVDPAAPGVDVRFWPTRMDMLRAIAVRLREDAERLEAMAAGMEGRDEGHVVVRP